MELARAPGLRARRLGREQRLRFQGLAASHSPHKSRTHVPSCRPQQRLDHAQGGFLLYRRLSACPRASLVPCLPKPGVRWSGLKCRGLIQVPVIAVNPLRSRAVPDNSCPARNGKRRPPRRCLAPIRPPLFLSHAMKGDGVSSRVREPPGPKGDNASRSRHRQRAKAADAGGLPPRRPHPGGLPPLPPDPRTAFRPRHPESDPAWTPSSARTGSRPASEGSAG
jgi:hypothetical protein